MSTSSGTKLAQEIHDEFLCCKICLEGQKHLIISIVMITSPVLEMSLFSYHMYICIYVYIYI